MSETKAGHYRRENEITEKPASDLRPGDVMVTHGREVAVSSVERWGMYVHVNGNSTIHATLPVEVLS